MATGGLKPAAPNRTLIFIDEGNLTGIATKLNRSIDWVRLREFLSRDKHVVETFVYAGLPPTTPEWIEFRHKRERFLHWLEAEGFYVVRKQGRPTTPQVYKANVDIMMAVEATELSMQLQPDILVLVTGDGDFGFLACHLRRRGIRVEVAGFDANMGDDLKIAANLFIDLSRVIKGSEPQRTNDDELASTRIGH
jgi:uncharacterized LabA/DUF88 family protein